MKKLLLTAALVLAGMPAFAKDYTIKEMVQATGHVISVDADNHTIKIRHDPIKALGWPAMTMLFTADSNVNLSGYQAGDVVSFMLKPQGKDDYIIANMKKGE